MSGGLDSTSVAASQKGAGRGNPGGSLRAYTVDYTPLFEDEEGAFATRVAQHLGIPIDILAGASASPFGGWEEALLSTPEPCAEPFFALHVEHYRQVAQRARVVLTGDGGDDIMTGRAWPYLVYLLKRGRIVSNSLEPSADMFIAMEGFRLFVPGIRTRLRRWMGRKEELGYPEWLEPRFERDLDLRDRWRELQQPAKTVHPLHPEGYAALTGAFWPSVLRKRRRWVDRRGSGARAPLLDQRLLRFLLRVPTVPVVHQ